MFAQMVNVLSAINEVGVPQIVPLLVPKFRPAGKVELIAQEVIVPEPVSVAFSGRSLLACPFVSVKFSGEYESVGTWSLTVKLKYATTDPPVLFAHTLYAVLVHNSVGVPYSVPLLLPKEMPLGRLVLFNSHDIIEPEPVMLGTNGKSLDAVLLVKVTFSGL